mmetsp:Transcript_68226/g.162860  ORF Transcript_68226/g.162860 Transcript_68226/m.162860 type:complete len:229 (-) Transcript_68226:272-958(-)
MSSVMWSEAEEWRKLRARLPGEEVGERLLEHLVVIVLPRVPIVERLVHERVHECAHLALGLADHVQALERGDQLRGVLPRDTRQPQLVADAGRHHLDEQQDLVAVLRLPRLQEPLDAQLPKVGKRPRVLPAHHLDVFAGELEGGLFERHVPRRVGKHEPEVDVHDVPVPCQQKVPVVTVFHLEEIAEDSVSRHALDEVALRRFVLPRVLRPVALHEVGVEGLFGRGPA